MVAKTNTKVSDITDKKIQIICIKFNFKIITFDGHYIKKILVVKKKASNMIAGG